MACLFLDPDLEDMLKLAREKSARDGGQDNAAILCALIQVQASRRGYCSQSDCGDCPLGNCGCVSSDRKEAAERFFDSLYPQKKVA